MRQYRGLTKEGKWVYGWYVQSQRAHNIIPTGVSEWYGGGVGKYFYGATEVIPESVGQQVPIKDIDNKWMYVGDIIGRDEFVRQIIWNEDFCCYQAPFRDGSGLQLFTQKSLGIFKIIGNIHQHPNLLEQDNA